MTGFQFDPTQSILGLLLFIIGILATVLTTRLKSKADDTTAQTGVSQQTWGQVKEWMEQQRLENNRLQGEIEGLRKQVTALIQDKATSDREMHHKDSIIADLSEALMAYQRWAAAGAKGSPPAIAWHLAEHLERLRR